MFTQWTSSSAALPHEGQNVQFVLDGRDVAMEGAYVRRIFRTRWTDYDVERVRTWRCTDSNAAESAAAQPALADLSAGPPFSAAGRAGARDPRSESLAA